MKEKRKEERREANSSIAVVRRVDADVSRGEGSKEREERLEERGRHDVRQVRERRGRVEDRVQ